MGILSIFNRKKIEPKGLINGQPYMSITRLYDGEKTAGELGAPLNYIPDYTNLSFRSWQAWTESDIAKLIVNNDVDWVIGKGLKMEAEPIVDIINRQNLQFNEVEFVNQFETRFRAWSDMKESTHSQMMSLHGLAKEARKHAIVGGDCLIVLRYEKRGVTAQLIDGMHIQTPYDKVTNEGKDIRHGVEVDKTGKHIAFHIRTGPLVGDVQRVLAYGAKTNRLQAFMVYGSRYRIDNTRGLPLLSVVLEKMKKLDRYTEASVGGAEERAKIVMQITHDQTSTGESPMRAMLKQSKIDKSEGGEIDYNQKAIQITQSTGKQTFNMPIGSQLKAIESNQEMNYDPFMKANFQFICAAVDIPPEVALNKYENNFSASRMASKSWEFKVEIKRDEFANVFYKPYSNMFLEQQVLNNFIPANGYFTAKQSNDLLLLEAYRKTRWIGPKVPHVDPLKEAKAEEVKLKNYLTTHEKATENLNAGDFESNVKRLKKEKENLKGLEPGEPEQQ